MFCSPSQCCDGLHLRSDDATTTRGIILYVSRKSMYRPKGYGFCTVLVWKHTVGIDFVHAFWSGIGYGFWGNYGSVWTYLSFQFQMYTKERDINMQIRISFVGVESKKWWHNFLEARSENGCEKWNFLVSNKVTIWRTVWHTPTKKIQEYSPLPPPRPVPPLKSRWNLLEKKEINNR